MSQIIRIKRGLDANLGNQAFALGEIVYTTDTKRIYIGDGSTNGGIEIDYIKSTEKGANDGVASLDAGGKIPNAQLPALAITDVNTAPDQATQIGLTAQEGDVCVRTDENKSYIHNGGTAGDMTDWQEMLTPTDAVSSVNGATGAVTLDTDDISEGSTNLYYTDARSDARIAAASIDALSDVDTNTTAPANDDYLKFNGTNWVPGTPATLAIDDLSDVDTTTSAPTNGQTLHWDGTNWVPADDDSSINSLDDIADVNVTGVTDGQIITWDDTASEWQAGDLPTGVDGTFKGLTDTPNAYGSGDAKKFLKVNAAEDAVEFATTSADDLSDIDTTTTAPTDGQVMAWDNANSNWVPADVDGGTF